MEEEEDGRRKWKKMRKKEERRVRGDSDEQTKTDCRQFRQAGFGGKKRKKNAFFR